MRVDKRKFYDIVFYDKNKHSLNIGFNKDNGFSSLFDIIKTIYCVLSNRHKQPEETFEKIKFFTIYDIWDKKLETYKVVSTHYIYIKLIKIPNFHD